MFIWNAAYIADNVSTQALYAGMPNNLEYEQFELYTPDDGSDETEIDIFCGELGIFNASDEMAYAVTDGFGESNGKISADRAEYGEFTSSGEYCFALEYEVAYNLNGGRFAQNYTAPQAYLYSVGIDELPVAGQILKDGYIFTGWTNADGEQVTAIPADSTGSLQLFASYLNKDNLENWHEKDTDYAYYEAVGYWIDKGNFDISWYDANKADKTFTLLNESQLAGLAKLMSDVEANVNLSGYTIILGADMDMSAHKWSNFEFSGTFDGNGHTISGIILDGEQYYSAGFISALYYGTLKNLNLVNSYIGGYLSNYTGGLVGWNYMGTIVNCSVRAYVKAASNSIAGGIVGTSTGRDINCVHNNYFVGTLYADGETIAGGIAGKAVFETVYNNYAIAFNLATNSYLAFAGISSNSDLKNNYSYFGDGMRADFNVADYTDTAQLLASLNGWVDAYITANGLYDYYYGWKIVEGINDDYPVFDGLYYQQFTVGYSFNGAVFIGDNTADSTVTRERDFVVEFSAQRQGYLRVMVFNMDGTPVPLQYYKLESQKITLYKQYITGNLYLEITETPLTDILYKVERYFEDLSGDFVLDSTKTSEEKGQTDQAVSAEITDTEHFVFDTDNSNNILSGAILYDGSLTLRVYYKRTRHSVVFKDGESILLSLNLPYGQTPQYGGTTPEKASTFEFVYTFKGWSSEIAPVTADAVYGALFDTKRIYAQTDTSGGGTDASISLPVGMQTDILLLVAAAKINESLTVPEGQKTLSTYNASLFCGSVKIEPELVAGQQYVLRIKLPNEAQNAQNLRVVMLENGIVKVVTPELTEDGYLVFSCKSLGDFALVADIDDKSSSNAGLVAGLSAAVLVAAVFVLLFWKHSVVYLLDGREIARVKLRFRQNIRLPHNARPYLWYADSALTQFFTQQKMKCRNITVYAKDRQNKNNFDKDD